MFVPPNGLNNFWLSGNALVGDAEQITRPHYDSRITDLFRENQLGFPDSGGIFPAAPTGEVCR
jgi:hypothetical protein